MTGNYIAYKHFHARSGDGMHMQDNRATAAPGGDKRGTDHP